MVVKGNRANSNISWSASEFTMLPTNIGDITVLDVMGTTRSDSTLSHYESFITLGVELQLIASTPFEEGKWNICWWKCRMCKSSRTHTTWSGCIILLRNQDVADWDSAARGIKRSEYELAQNCSGPYILISKTQRPPVTAGGTSVAGGSKDTDVPTAVYTSPAGVRRERIDLFNMPNGCINTCDRTQVGVSIPEAFTNILVLITSVSV
jgi:hypothetical protein